MRSESCLSSSTCWSWVETRFFPTVALGILALQTLSCAPHDSVYRATLEPKRGAGAPTAGASGSGDAGWTPLPDPNPDAATAGNAAMGDQTAESDPLPGSALDASPPPPDVPPPDTLPHDMFPPDTLAHDTLSTDVVRPASPMGPNCVGMAPWRDGRTYQPAARVTNLNPRRLYECRPWPNSEWCGLVTYQPGMSLYWSDAWIYRGLCL